jgi:hypothetical protein
VHLALLLLALQVPGVALSEPSARPAAPTAADSARDLRRAQSGQLSFERNRRNWLPTGYGGGGRCDVRLGRFCWWYDDHIPTFPPEAQQIRARRAELIASLDEMGLRYPGDDWLAGMRVHYRVDGRDFAAADTVARACAATPWWCGALVGYAAHMLGDGARADSAFAFALAAMPADSACSWRDITALLGDADRAAYEPKPCEARRPMEVRYWLLSRPQLASGANEWQNEFNVRRVLSRLAEHSATPQSVSWGRDAAELLLRYGWPSAWSRMPNALTMGANAEPGIIGHDPSPSFAFAPAGRLADSLGPLPFDAWDLVTIRAEARYAPRLVRRVAGVSAQVARFRRGDSTLVVAAFAASDDSLHAPIATLAATDGAGVPALSVPDTGRAGRARVTVPGAPMLVGIEVADTTTRTLARTRLGFARAADSAQLVMSDLLAYRAGAEPPATIDSALARAIPGDTVSRDRPLGLFWETYGSIAEGETVEHTVTVERIDRGFIRSTRQRLRISPEDTPIRITWTDARPPNGRTAGHAISLDLGNVALGRYRVTLTLTPLGGSTASTSREIALIER